MGHEKHFSESGFWKHVKRFAGSFAEDKLSDVFLAYYAMTDDDVPTWAKTSLGGALGYFVFPLDAIPDFTPPPPVGFTDDFGVIAAALVAVAAHITPEMRAKARRKAREWLA